MNNCFSVYFNGYEIILPKSSVTFKYGYGVVKAVYNAIHDGMIFYEPIVGIVNENFELVYNMVPKYLMPKTEMLPNDIIIRFKDKSGSGINDYCVYSCKDIDNEIVSLCNLNASDFQTIDDNLISLIFVFETYSLVALYNVNSCKIISDYYNCIGEFKENSLYNELVAEAVIFLHKLDNSEVNRIVCYINKSGKVISLYINVDSKETYDNSLVLSEVFCMINNDYSPYTR